MKGKVKGSNSSKDKQRGFIDLLKKQEIPQPDEQPDDQGELSPVPEGGSSDGEGDSFSSFAGVEEIHEKTYNTLEGSIIVSDGKFKDTQLNEMAIFFSVNSSSRVERLERFVDLSHRQAFFEGIKNSLTFRVRTLLQGGSQTVTNLGISAVHCFDNAFDGTTDLKDIWGKCLWSLRQLFLLANQINLKQVQPIELAQLIVIFEELYPLRKEIEALIQNITDQPNSDIIRRLASYCSFKNPDSLVSQLMTHIMDIQQLNTEEIQVEIRCEGSRESFRKAFEEEITYLKRHIKKSDNLIKWVNFFKQKFSESFQLVLGFLENPFNDANFNILLEKILPVSNQNVDMDLIVLINSLIAFLGDQINVRIDLIVKSDKREDISKKLLILAMNRHQFSQGLEILNFEEILLKDHWKGLAAVNLDHDAVSESEDGLIYSEVMDDEDFASCASSESEERSSPVTESQDISDDFLTYCSIARSAQGVESFQIPRSVDFSDTKEITVQARILIDNYAQVVRMPLAQYLKHQQVEGSVLKPLKDFSELMTKFDGVSLTVDQMKQLLSLVQPLRGLCESTEDEANRHRGLIRKVLAIVTQWVLVIQRGLDRDPLIGLLSKANVLTGERGLAVDGQDVGKILADCIVQGLNEADSEKVRHSVLLWIDILKEKAKGNLELSNFKVNDHLDEQLLKADPDTVQFQQVKRICLGKAVSETLLASTGVQQSVSFNVEQKHSHDVVQLRRLLTSWAEKDQQIKVQVERIKRNLDFFDQDGWSKSSYISISMDLLQIFELTKDQTIRQAVSSYMKEVAACSDPAILEHFGFIQKKRAQLVADVRAFQAQINGVDCEGEFYQEVREAITQLIERFLQVLSAESITIDRYNLYSENLQKHLMELQALSCKLSQFGVELSQAVKDCPFGEAVYGTVCKVFQTLGELQGQLQAMGQLMPSETPRPTMTITVEDQERQKAAVTQFCEACANIANHTSSHWWAIQSSDLTKARLGAIQYHLKALLREPEEQREIEFAAKALATFYCSGNFGKSHWLFGSRSNATTGMRAHFRSLINALFAYQDKALDEKELEVFFKQNFNELYQQMVGHLDALTPQEQAQWRSLGLSIGDAGSAEVSAILVSGGSLSEDEDPSRSSTPGAGVGF